MGARSYQPAKRGWWHLDRVPRIRSWLFVAGVILFYFESFLLPALFGMDAMLATVLGGIATAGLFGFLYARQKCHIRHFGRDVHGMKTYIGWILVFVVSTFVLEFLFHFIDIHVADPGMESRADTIEGYGVAFFALYAIFLAPLIEEVMMRLFSYSVLRSSCSRVTATVGTALLFGYIHGTVSHMVVATMLGCILAFSYEATGKWFVPVIGHYIYNTMVLFVFTDNMLLVSESVPFIVADIAAAAVILALCCAKAWRPELFLHKRKEAEAV